MSTYSIFTSLLIILLTGQMSFADFGSRDCYKHRSKRNGFAWDERRGNPWDFDPGPANEESRSWVELYGQVPNYRSIGRAILGGDKEKFRWTMGPMWYRGRLGKNQVKVFVVGQEGAQDENVTNRAFTGSTGTRVQKFMNHLGIYESYLYMNTYVYTIKEQRDLESKSYMALEQNLNSPIVQYRHMLFDNVIKQNPDSIALFMAVGGGGKDSLATWINARSGNKKCIGKKLHLCDTTKLVEYFKKRGFLGETKKILAIGVNHPGGAAFGDGNKHIRASFDRAAKAVGDYLKKYDGWLPADSQETQFANCSGGERVKRLAKPFEYGHAPIPFKDFAFATNWRMGDKGTASNRKGAHRIQVFSEHGQYATVNLNNRKKIGERHIPWGKVKLKKEDGGSGRTVFNDIEPIYDFYKAPSETSLQLLDKKKGLLHGMKSTEVPYEPPRFSAYGYPEEGDFNHAAAFDPGPATTEIAQALGQWPNFQEIDNQAYINDESFGFGPSYRGNTKDPKFIIIADQMGHSDFFSTRALTGEAGQRLQTFLNKTGLEDSRDYLILRPLPVDTLGINVSKKVSLALNSDTKGNSAAQSIAKILKLLPHAKTVLTMGPVAKEIAHQVLKNQMSELNISKIENMVQPDKNYSHTKNWVTLATKLQLKTPLASDLEAMYIIPRSDLPYSTRWWMGSTGERAERAYGESEYAKANGREFNYQGHYYRIVAPDWARKIWNDPRPMNSIEKQQVNDTLMSL